MAYSATEYQLTHLLVDVYARLGQLNASTATDGSTTTIVDTKQTGQHSDDDWNNGTAFIIRDAGGAGAAPEGEFVRISDYVDSSGTFTIDAVTAAVASGDRFAFVSDYYPLHTMIEIMNDGLRALGDVVLVDTTTLDTASNQTEYTAAVTWKRRRPIRIDYQWRTGDTDDHLWTPLYNWDYIPAAPGSTGLIIFAEQPQPSRDLRIWYEDQHPSLSAYSDPISETFPPELVVSACVEESLAWQNSRVGGSDPFLLQRWNDAQVKLARAQAMFPVWRPRRVSKLMPIQTPLRRYPGDPDALVTR